MTQVFRHDADDLGRLAVEPNLRADHVRIAAELLVPRCFGDHGNRRAGLIGGLVVGAAEQRRRIEHVEEGRRRLHPGDAYGFAAAREVDDVRTVARNGREHRRALLHVAIVGG